MKTLAIIPLVAMSFVACHAQDQKEEITKQETQPKESWRVNKEVDNNGNVIRYDSTYTWSYSIMNGDTNTVQLDSVMDSFDDFFKTQLPFLWSNHFSFSPHHDSLLRNNFFKPNYFFDQWEQQHFNVKKMLQEMDSIRNEFLNKNYPGLMDSKQGAGEEDVIQ